MGLFSAKPKLERGDPHFLMEQVANLENQKSLAWIVKNEKNAVLREIAIKKLNPLKWMKLLKKIAKKEDEDFQVQLAAFSKLEEYVNIITDYEKLVKISKNGLGIGDRDNFIREAAEKRLEGLKTKKEIDSPIEGLIEELVEHHSVAAAEALGRIGDQRAEEPLIDALSDDNFMVRGAAAKSLRLLGSKNPRAVNFLIDILKKDPLDCGDAIMLLGEIGDPRAIKPIKAVEKIGQIGLYVDYALRKFLEKKNKRRSK